MRRDKNLHIRKKETCVSGRKEKKELWLVAELYNERTLAKQQGGIKVTSLLLLHKMTDVFQR